MLLTSEEGRQLVGARGGYENDTCFRCGEVGHWATNCRLPRDKRNDVCFKCGRSGHWSNQCPQRYFGF
ncbi:hypothetical protein FGO68_gene8023 [Halteria grandinella]|uniref:CCHC-type domain-containing protein n=1 Tax=Halteria grandinella TaxID=5974 RepID=A0A8J8T4W3_HALGN|nr:hypothetical protein FGO68_gene8023 [Halteria grandinella]